MKELIEAIIEKNQATGIDINPPATLKNIADFEKKVGFILPDEFREFYLIRNGFGCVEDIFNIFPLEKIDDYGTNWFTFADYMIFSDTWGLRINADDQYEIFNGSYPEIPLTASLTDFLDHFLKGNVFESGGLYDWLKELGIE